MTDSTFVKETYYFVQGLDLDRPISDHRGVDAAREEIASLQQRVRQALSKHPESVRILGESEVPTPPLYASRGSAGTIRPSCPEDVHLDGMIDIVDIQMVAGGWSGSNPLLDVDDYGDVDTNDVQQVANRWQQACP